jgi:tetratricopeptide (TPR) repeat protein
MMMGPVSVPSAFRGARWILALALATTCFAAPSCGRVAESERAGLLDEGDRALAEGRLADAEATFLRLRRAFPQDARAAFGLGLARLRQGNAAASLVDFDASLQLEPDNVEHAYLRAVEQWPREPRVTLLAGRAALAAGRPREALQCFEMARRVHPWDPDTVAGIAATLEAMGRNQEALAAQPILEDLKHRANLIQDLAREASMAKEDPAPAGRLAQRLFEEGRLEDAMSATEDYLQRFPKEDFGGSLAVRAAQAASTMGDGPRAGRFLEAAMKGNRSHVERAAAAEVQMMLGRLDDAFASFESLLSERPDDPDAILGLGRVAMSTGRLDRAEPELRRAVKMSPDSAAAHAALGLLLIKRQDADGARAELDRALKLSPDLPDALFGLGFLAHQQRRLDDAERLLRRALELQPRHSSARAVLAMVLADQGSCEEAIPMFTRGLQEDYRNASLHMGLIRCYEATGRTAEAEAARKLAREIQGVAP